MLVTSLRYLHTLLLIFFYYMVVITIMTWIPGIYEKGWYQNLRKTIDWYMGRFRGWLVLGPIDFTPILGFIFFKMALVGLELIINLI